MAKSSLSVLIAAMLTGSSVQGEELMALESTAEVSVGSAELMTQLIASDPLFFASLLGPESASYLVATAGTLMTVGGGIMLINRPRLMRRYRDAAAEANQLKIAHPATPIDHAAADGSLVEVLKHERLVAREVNFAIDRLSQVQLANLVIARARLLAAE